MNQIEENFDNQSLIEVDQDLAEFKSFQAKNITN